MSILVTGAAGFIGCNCVLALNKAGFNDIIAVDNLTRAEKFLNLAQGHITDYFDKNDFIERVRKGTAPIPEAVVHMGACSDTMETDGRYIMENNYRYTLDLFAWAQKLKIPFVPQLRHFQAGRNKGETFFKDFQSFLPTFMPDEQLYSTDCLCMDPRPDRQFILHPGFDPGRF